MIDPRPVTLERDGVRLEPLADHPRRDGSARDTVMFRLARHADA